MAIFKSPSSPRLQTSRRLLLRTIALFFGVIATSFSSLIPIWAKWAPSRLRPPGALPEDELLASCIKCGQCVQVCPVQAIRLADLDEGIGVGVPYIQARNQACDFSCDAVQCILACPTGSLSHTISKKEEVRMGLARIVRPQACLAYLGQGFQGLARGANFPGLLRYADIDRWQPLPIREHPYDLKLCDLCVRHCPIEQAISLQSVDDNQTKRMIPVIHQACVGCGTCEMMCPVEPTVIIIEARKTWENMA